MATTTYTVFDGEIIEENRAGTIRDYVPDPLGSTRALLNSSQTQTDTWDYWPYGEVESRTGETATPFTFIGVYGYYSGGAGGTYIRARWYDASSGQWSSVDHIWPSSAAYGYVKGGVTNYVDPSGNQGEPPRKEGCKVYRCYPLESNWGHSFICVDGPTGGCSGGLYFSFMGGQGDETYGHPCVDQPRLRCTLLSTDCAYAGHVCACLKYPANDWDFLLDGFCHGYVHRIRCCGCKVYHQEGWYDQYYDCVKKHCNPVLNRQGSNADWSWYMTDFPGPDKTGGRGGSGGTW